MLLTQAEWARQEGFSRQYAAKLVAKGVVRLVEGKVDPAQAKAALAAMREPARVPQRKAVKAAPAPTPASAAKPPPAAKPAPLPSLDLPGGPGGDLSTLLLKARIKSEVKRASLLEIREKVETGKLVDADEVRAAAFNRGRVTRDRLIKLPDRLAAILAAESDPRRVHELLSRELQGALDHLAEGTA